MFLVCLNNSQREPNVHIKKEGRFIIKSEKNIINTYIVWIYVSCLGIPSTIEGRIKIEHKHSAFVLHTWIKTNTLRIFLFQDINHWKKSILFMASVKWIILISITNRFLPKEIGSDSKQRGIWKPSKWMRREFRSPQACASARCRLAIATRITVSLAHFLTATLAICLHQMIIAVAHLQIFETENRSAQMKMHIIFNLSHICLIWHDNVNSISISAIHNWSNNWIIQSCNSQPTLWNWKMKKKHILLCHFVWFSNWFYFLLLSCIPCPTPSGILFIRCGFWAPIIKPTRPLNILINWTAPRCDSISRRDASQLKPIRNFQEATVVCKIALNLKHQMKTWRAFYFIPEYLFAQMLTVNSTYNDKHHILFFSN